LVVDAFQDREQLLPGVQLFAQHLAVILEAVRLSGVAVFPGGRRAATAEPKAQGKRQEANARPSNRVHLSLAFGLLPWSTAISLTASAPPGMPLTRMVSLRSFRSTASNLSL